MVLICMYAKFSPTQRCRPERGEGKSLDNIMISKDCNWRHNKKKQSCVPCHALVLTVTSCCDHHDCYSGHTDTDPANALYTIRVIQKTNIVQRHQISE